MKHDESSVHRIHSDRSLGTRAHFWCLGYLAFLAPLDREGITTAAAHFERRSRVLGLVRNRHGTETRTCAQFRGGNHNTERAGSLVRSGHSLGVRMGSASLDCSAPPALLPRRMEASLDAFHLIGLAMVRTAYGPAVRIAYFFDYSRYHFSGRDGSTRFEVGKTAA